MEAIKDIISLFLGSLILLISLITIPEVRRKKRYWIPVVLMVVLSSWLGYDKYNRDNKKEATFVAKNLASVQKIIQLEVLLKSLKDSLSTNHKSDMAFQKELREKFAIMKDSTNNPVKIKTFNNYIDRARDVYIGND